MKIIKKIYTILVLLSNIIIRRRHYTLSFHSEYLGTDDNPKLVKLWYYNFKGWGFRKENLLMVSGADGLCEHYSKDGGKTATVKIVASRKDLHYGCKYDHYVAENIIKSSFLDRILLGRNYLEDQRRLLPEKQVNPKRFWICPVTLFVLGRYPKHLYIVNKHYKEKINKLK
jgi:hypothetical protein